MERETLSAAIRDCAGMAHLNRSHERTFSLNIFHLNAKELMVLVRRFEDPDEMLHLNAVQNREAAEQAHRELNRRIHNFVASARTLVDHTRAFMHEHYAGSPAKVPYLERVQADFLNNPMTKFVEDLRNYMLHRGLPQQERFLEIESNPAAGRSQASAGVRYRAAVLLEWDKWTAPARAFLQTNTPYLNVADFVVPYVDVVTRFHDWLKTHLDTVHSEDLMQLHELQRNLQILEANILSRPAGVPRPDPEVSVASEQPQLEINSAAADVLQSIRLMKFSPQQKEAFKSERPVAHTLTEADMRGHVRAWLDDDEGRYVLAFIQQGENVYGIDEAVFEKIDEIVILGNQLDQVSMSLSAQFIGDTLIEWLQKTFCREVELPFSTFLIDQGKAQVRPLSLWMPIAGLEIEKEFSLGPVRIAPMTSALFDGLQRQCLGQRQDVPPEVVQAFAEWRREMQGLAAVVLDVTTEPRRLQEIGEILGPSAVSLLRFLCPMASSLTRVSTVALLGGELQPSRTTLMLGDGPVLHKGLLMPSSSENWRLSETERLARLERYLGALGALVSPAGLTPFALAVRTALMLFSTGTTLIDPIDRLLYAISALETTLLRHREEIAEFSVEDRVSRILADDKPQEHYRQVVRDAYRTRIKRGTSDLTSRDLHSMNEFLLMAHRILRGALLRLGSHASVSDFCGAIDAGHFRLRQSTAQ